jgi:hypothetical protein
MRRITNALGLTLLVGIIMLILGIASWGINLIFSHFGTVWGGIITFFSLAFLIYLLDVSEVDKHKED